MVSQPPLCVIPFALARLPVKSGATSVVGCSCAVQCDIVLLSSSTFLLRKISRNAINLASMPWVTK